MKADIPAPRRCESRVLTMSLSALTFMVLSPGLRSVVRLVPCQGACLGQESQESWFLALSAKPAPGGKGRLPTECD